MDIKAELIIYVGIAIFAVLILWLLKEWKRRCMFGGWSKRNSKMLRAAAAARQTSRTRQNGESRNDNIPRLAQHIIVLPPPDFETALSCPSPIYIIETEQPPPSYSTVVNVDSTNNGIHFG